MLKLKELTRFRFDSLSGASAPLKALSMFRKCSKTVLLANTWLMVSTVFSWKPLTQFDVCQFLKSLWIPS